MKQPAINIRERMDHYQVSGLSMALMDHGKINSVKSYGLLEAGTTKQVNKDSIFSACSISKFVTSMLAITLVEQGLLDLDEDVNKRLTSWKVPVNEFTEDKKVTLRHLLSHQSGIIDPEGSFTELHTMNEKPSMAELLAGKTPFCDVPIELTYEPGSEFHYSDAGFCIIHQLIEDVLKRPFKQVMNEHVLEPLNMENSTLETALPKTNKVNFSSGHNKNGAIVDGKYPIYPYPAASGLWTTPSDLAQLVMELMHALKGQSKLGISANKAKEMIRAQGCSKWTGLGVFLDDSQKNAEISSLGWGVGFQCMMVAYPYEGTGLVIMTNADSGVHQLKGIIGEIYHSLVF